MNGPRLLSRAHALALAGLILLPACAPRTPIPSDPPEARTEAQVRGEHKAPPQRRAERAPDTRPVTHDKSDVVIAEATDPMPSNPPAEAKTAPAPEAKAPNQADSSQQTPAPAPKPASEAKAQAHETEEPKAETPAPKPEPSPEAKADAAEQAAKAQESGQQTPEHRTPVVQIASFTTEKNAEAARAWLTEKGYAEARVVRVEQGQAAFHRVQAGPFQDLAAARKALEELKADWPQAFIPAD